MTNKEILYSIATALAITLSTSTIAGNITLKSQNEPKVIIIKCGPTPTTETDTHLFIPPNGQRGPLPYVLIKAGFHHSHLSCDFYEDGSNKDIATANLYISDDFTTATITNAENFDPSQFYIKISTPLNLPAESITAVVEKI
ncbi:MAG: hypothetical protein A3E82_05230 [Gammaproteobacteria bacterium RIFCSPHIGHO2_12_FULL_38_11]|nr:MAG: hypothetical protein A3E82_05230 [Gammaproteobacteria bacterium RIFCSPHIGHO2_12_FULL_38_11]